MELCVFDRARELLSRRSTRSLEFPLLLFVYYLFFSSIILMLGLWWGASFACAAVFVVLAIIPAGALAILDARSLNQAVGFRVKENGWLLGLTLLACLLGSLVSSAINRPDADDSIYLPKPVFYIENPHATLDQRVNWIAALPSVAKSGVFHYYEAIQAALAVEFDIPFLDVYYIVFPALVAFLMMLGTCLQLSIFIQSRSQALVGLVVFFLVMMFLCESHRSFGNISVARTFQAKYMFLTVGVPAWIYFSLRFLILRKLASWWALPVLALTMGASTTTALIFFPFLALLIFTSYALTSGLLREPDRTLRLALEYGASLLPMVPMVLFLKLFFKANAGAAGVLNASFPSGFKDQLLLLVNQQYPISIPLFLISLLAVLVLSRYRWFLGGWVALAVVFFLNPLVSGFIIKYVTTSNIYWRLFYLLPFPLLVSIFVAELSARGFWGRGAATLIVLAAFYAAFWGPTAAVRPENNATWGFGYKVTQPGFSVAQEIVRKLSPGSMFAPRDVSENLLLLSSKFPQFHMREDYLGYVLVSVDGEADYRNRIDVYRSLYGGDWQSLSSGLKKLPTRPDFIVVPAEGPASSEVGRILFESGYQQLLALAQGYLVYAVGQP